MRHGIPPRGFLNHISTSYHFRLCSKTLTDKDQLASTLLMTAGMALLYEFDVDTPKSWYVGAQVLFGFGVGFGNQVPVTAVQGLSKPEDVPSSTALMFSKCPSCGRYLWVRKD